MAYDDDGDSVVTLFSNVESVVTVVEFLQPVEFGRVVDEVDQVLEVECGQEKFDDEVDHTFGVKDLEEEVGDEVGEQEDEELVEEEFEDEVVEEEDEEDFKFGGFHPVRAGTRLNSRYCTVKKLGTGAFSQVWQCRDLEKGGQVAVKVLKSNSFVTEMGEEEAELLANLTKSRKEELVKLLGQFVKDGPNGRHVCIVTELCGPCLLEILPEYGMCLSNVKQVVGQVLAGLEFLHSKGIIHTDIKPENVLLSNNTSLTNIARAAEAIKVKLADFGGALQVDEISPAIVGTSEYRSPELLLEAPYGTEIDVWAAACLGFELATGTYLFKPVAKGMVSKEEMHLALITKVLGPAPQGLVRSGRSGKLMYSRRRGELHNFPQDGLGSEDLKELIGKRRGKPESEDEVFSKFLLTMLKWTREERSTAGAARRHQFVSSSPIVHVKKKVGMSIEEPADVSQDLEKEAGTYTAIETCQQDTSKNKTTERVRETLLFGLGKEKSHATAQDIDPFMHGKEDEEMSLINPRFAARAKDCKVNEPRLFLQGANRKEGEEGTKKNAGKRLREAHQKRLVKQAEATQSQATKEMDTVANLAAEKLLQSQAAQATDFQGPPLKQARRSARTSCPWEIDLTSQQLERKKPKSLWRSSEAMRKSGRPTNVKGSKMLPMGPLRCYSREMIKVEQKWAREVGEGGGYVGGFIDDVVNGERLVVDRPAKEFAYYTLRQRSHRGSEGSHQFEGKELPPMKALPIKATSTVEMMINDLGDEVERDHEIYWTISSI